MDHSFFQSLFTCCDDGRLETRKLPAKERGFYEVEDLSGIDVFCQSNQGQNLYFGVALRGKENTGGKDNITQIPAVWCDVDYKDTPRERFIELYKTFPFKPSIPAGISNPSLVAIT